MKPTPEIESAAKSFFSQFASGPVLSRRQPTADDLAHFLAKIIAQERAKVWEEAARVGREDEIMVTIEFGSARETKRDWGIKVVESLCRMFEDRAAASRKESEGE